MAQLWQMTREVFISLMGQSDGGDMHCKCDWTDDDNENSELDESSGIGTVIVIFMVLAGLFIGAHWIPSQLTQGSRLQRREQQQQLQQQQQLLQQQQRGQASRTELRKKALNKINNNHNNTIADSLDDWQDVLLPQNGEEVYWLIQAQQHNLLLLNNDQQQLRNDQQQLRQLQQQLMLTLSLQDVYHDLPIEDSDEDHFRDILDSSQVELTLLSTSTSTTTTTATTTATATATATTTPMINS
ncbi:myb-like protein AA [Drosophila innubila]|uniref:myb-like protein AA n=1 Tax=Drosophila innubila TaxID=198719 RepID=UPI00148C59E6|nr:myb-like protein AA [Drosophila innubila]XP_034487445.1 myb-like protein AA [Drosophila innubila]